MNNTRIADVSLQHIIASEVFAVHPTGPVIGSDGVLKTAPTIDLSNVSMHRNLMAHNSHRNPMTAADNGLYANNVVYNWSQGAGMMNRRGVADWVNNYGKAGPMTRSQYSYMVNAYCDEMAGDFSIYAAGNVGPMSQDPQGDNWSGDSRQVACYYQSGATIGAEVDPTWKRDLPQDWASAPYPVDVVPAVDAYERVLADVGANARIDCDGSWVVGTDSVDARIVDDARDGTGAADPPIDENEPAIGGYPAYATGQPCPDSDADGLPDAWEQRFFGCDECAEPGDSGRAGYLLIEHYVNGTAP
jgi:hypothetical protein